MALPRTQLGILCQACCLYAPTHLQAAHGPPLLAVCGEAAAPSWLSSVLRECFADGLQTEKAICTI